MQGFKIACMVILLMLLKPYFANFLIKLLIDLLLQLQGFKVACMVILLMLLKPYFANFLIKFIFHVIYIKLQVIENLQTHNLIL